MEVIEDTFTENNGSNFQKVATVGIAVGLGVVAWNKAIVPGARWIANKVRGGLEKRKAAKAEANVGSVE